MVACADMITACAETNGCMCRHDHCIRRSLHVHAMSVYSHQDTPMYMQTLLLKHTARHKVAIAKFVIVSKQLYMYLFQCVISQLQLPHLHHLSETLSHLL